MSQDVPYQKGGVGFLLRRNAARPPAICACLTVNKERLLLGERRLESPRILVGRERGRVGIAGCSQQKLINNLSDNVAVAWERAILPRGVNWTLIHNNCYLKRFFEFRNRVRYCPLSVASWSRGLCNHCSAICVVIAIVCVAARDLLSAGRFALRHYYPLPIMITFIIA